MHYCPLSQVREDKLQLLHFGHVQKANFIPAFSPFLILTVFPFTELAQVCGKICFQEDPIRDCENILKYG